VPREVVRRLSVGGQRVRADRWEAIRRLFADAVEQHPSERAAFLADRCGLDLLLRREVEALLAADRSARDGRFLRDAVRAVAGRLAAVRESSPERRLPR